MQVTDQRCEKLIYKVVPKVGFLITIPHQAWNGWSKQCARFWSGMKDTCHDKVEGLKGSEANTEISI